MGTMWKAMKVELHIVGTVLSLFCAVLVWWFMSYSFPGKHTYLFDLQPGLLLLVLCCHSVSRLMQIWTILPLVHPTDT